MVHLPVLDRFSLELRTSPGFRSAHPGYCLNPGTAQASGRDLELVALDLGEVLTLDADQLGVARASRRMQDAFIVDVRGAGLELVDPHLGDLARRAVLRLLQEPP